MPSKFFTKYGLRVRTGGRLDRWLTRNRLRLTGAAARIRHPKSLANRTLALAAHFVGVKEYPAGSNLQEFGRWYGDNGVPWCAIFVSYCISHCGRPFRYAYVPYILADARAGRAGLSVIPATMVDATIRAGFPVLACFDWNKDGTPDHVGFVASLSSGQLHTIEGNTGSDNLSNGGEVLRAIRAVDLAEAFVKVKP